MRTAVGSFGMNLWCSLGLLLVSAVSAEHKHLESSRMMEDHFTSYSSLDPTLVELGETDIALAAASGSPYSVHDPVVQEPWKSTLPMTFGSLPGVMSSDAECTGVDNGNPKCASENRDSSMDLKPKMSVVAPSKQQAKPLQANTLDSVLKPEESRGNELDVKGELSSKPNSPNALNTADEPEAPETISTNGDRDVSGVPGTRTREVPQNRLAQVSEAPVKKPDVSDGSANSLPSDILPANQDTHLSSPYEIPYASQALNLPSAYDIPHITNYLRTPSAFNIQHAIEALRKPDDFTAHHDDEGRRWVSDVSHAAEDLHVPGADVAEYLTAPFVGRSSDNHANRSFNDNDTPQHSNTTIVPGDTNIVDRQISDGSNISNQFSKFVPLASHALFIQNIRNESSIPETPNNLNASYSVVPGISADDRVAPDIPGEAVPDANISRGIHDAPKIPEILDNSNSPDILGISDPSSFAKAADVPRTEDAPGTLNAHAAPESDYKFPELLDFLAENSPKIPDAPEVTQSNPINKQQSTVDETVQSKSGSLCPEVSVDRVTTFDITIPFETSDSNYHRVLSILIKNTIEPNRANRRSMYAPIEMQEMDFGNSFDSNMLTWPEVPDMRIVNFREEPEYQIEVRPAKKAVKQIGFSTVISMDNDDRKDDPKSKDNPLAKSLATSYTRATRRRGKKNDSRRLTDRLKVGSRARETESIRGHEVKGKERGYPRHLQ